MEEKTRKICEAREELEDLLIEQIALARSGVDIHHEIPGAIADMIKDLAEAEKNISDHCKNKVEMEYKKKIMKAMDDAEYGEDWDEDGPMGYNTRRYPSSGRYAPAGRGRIMGYIPDMMMAESETQRMGYTPTGSNRGRAYDEYSERRRHYKKEQSQENQQLMKDSRDKLMDEMEAIIMEAWPDMNQSEKTHYLQRGNKMINKLQNM